MTWANFFTWTNVLLAFIAFGIWKVGDVVVAAMQRTNELLASIDNSLNTIEINTDREL
jgi:hypothetical protein